jgi:hypothetical protein
MYILSFGLRMVDSLANASKDGNFSPARNFKNAF